MIYPALAFLTIAVHQSMEHRAAAGQQERPAAINTDESSLRFRASDILPAEVLHGPNYDVDEAVTLSDGRFVFRIQTSWGVIPARGRAFLELRLREMYAIERARQLGRDPQLINGFLDTLRNTQEGAKILLSDPAGALLRAPEGLHVGLANVLHPANHRAGSDVRRRLAASIDSDPETTNPVLKKLLDWLALQKGIGEVAGKVGLHLALPGLALVPTTAQVKQLVASRLPHEINADIQKRLGELRISRDLSRTFCRERHFTTTQRLVILQYLQLLEGVAQIDGQLQRAIRARNEAEGLAVIWELKLLEGLHRQHPVRAVVVSGGFPVAVHDGGQHVIVCVDDYVATTRRIIAFVNAYRDDFLTSPARFFTNATVSAPVRDLFQKAGIICDSPAASSASTTK